MTEADVLIAAREYIVDNFMYTRKNKDLADDASFLETGIISSLGMIEIVAWVEERFGITVAPTDITARNFDSVRNIARYVMAHPNVQAA
jgi:acyl carrier protein